MNIVCDREKLFAAFQTAALFAPSRSPKQILQNIKLDVEGSDVTMTATDMEVGVRLNVAGVEVEKPGSAVLSVANFGSILRESSDEKLKIESHPQGEHHPRRSQRVQTAERGSERVSFRRPL